MNDPGGRPVTFYVVGSEHTPEIFADPSMQKAREAFVRFQALADQE